MIQLTQLSKSEIHLSILLLLNTIFLTSSRVKAKNVLDIDTFARLSSIEIRHVQA